MSDKEAEKAFEEWWSNQREASKTNPREVAAKHGWLAGVQWEREGLSKDESILTLDEDSAIKVGKLQAQLAEAEKVIEFYGDKENWEEELRESYYVDDFNLSESTGKRAKAYLEKYKR